MLLGVAVFAVRVVGARLVTWFPSDGRKIGMLSVVCTGRFVLVY